jgi:hypothetical protein
MVLAEGGGRSSDENVLTPFIITMQFEKSKSDSGKTYSD